jgi:hypothetical protein
VAAASFANALKGELAACQKPDSGISVFGFGYEVGNLARSRNRKVAKSWERNSAEVFSFSFFRLAAFSVVPRSSKFFWETATPYGATDAPRSSLRSASRSRSCRRQDVTAGFSESRRLRPMHAHSCHEEGEVADLVRDRAIGRERRDVRAGCRVFRKKPTTLLTETGSLQSEPLRREPHVPGRLVSKAELMAVRSEGNSSYCRIHSRQEFTSQLTSSVGNPARDAHANGRAFITTTLRVGAEQAVFQGKEDFLSVTVGAS